MTMNGNADTEFVTRREFLDAEGTTAEEIGKLHGMVHNFLESQRDFMRIQGERDRAQTERDRTQALKQETRDRLYMEKLEALAGGAARDRCEVRE
jgi:hypothetical protein